LQKNGGRLKFLISIFLATGFPVLSHASLALLSVPSRPPLGRLAGTANPLGQKKAYAYDRISRVTEVADPAGNVTAYAYDALNRLTRREVRSPSGGRAVTDYTYDAVGNLLKAANGEGAVSYTYDALDRPVEAAQSFGGQAYTIGYAYDAVGNRTAMRTPWGG
jgi:YD repeat-containing protein